MTTRNITIGNQWTEIVAQYVSNPSSYPAQYWIGSTIPTDSNIGYILQAGKTIELFNFVDEKIYFKSRSDNQILLTTIDGYEAPISIGGSGGSAIDRELVVTTYTCKTAFTGASIGDTITATQIIDVTNAPTTILTIWRNQSTNLDLASAPSSANLTLAGAGIGLTNTQLRSAPIDVFLTNGSMEISNDNGNPVPISGTVEIANDVGNPISVSNDGAMIQFIPDVNFATMANYYDFNINNGDFIKVQPTANGQFLTSLSMNPLIDNHESSILLKNTVVPITVPHTLAISASMSQRPKGQFAVMEVINQSALSLPVTPETYTIATIAQTASVLTITLANPINTGVGTVGLNIGDWIDVSGVTTDNRANYSNLVIATISEDGRTLTCTVADDNTIPSATITSISNQGIITYRPQLNSASDGYGMRLSGTVATEIAYLSKFGGYETQVSGTFNGKQSVTSASTAPIWTAAASGQYDVKATAKFLVQCDPQSVVFKDLIIDSNTATQTPRTTRTDVKPNGQSTYGVRFRAVTPKSIAKPIARITNISKAGSTTATVTTDVPHGLATGNYVTIKGVVNQTDFPNTTTPTIITVTGTNTFTLVLGATLPTVSSYGGAVISCTNGGIDQQGISSVSIQSIARDTNGIYTFIGTGTWAAPIAIGEYINMYGLIGSTGNDLGYDGVYEVMSISGTTLKCRPVQESLANTWLSSNATTLVSTTPCGGIAILRTTLRSHDIVGYIYKQQMVQIDGQGTVDYTKALPVSILNSIAATVSQATAANLKALVDQGAAAAISATTGLGGWFTHPAVVGLPDITSAALTTTTTSTVIANNLGNAFEVVMTTTAVTGTTPTLDLRIEESFDGGTNWHTLYEFERVTATGIVKSPMLRANGRHIRYVQTVTGTTPSFTRAVTRNVFPSSTADKITRLFDRAISLTTLSATTASLFAGSASNVQLVVNIGAATTAPILKLQGSEDGINWYDLSTTTLTAVASSTVQLTLNNINAPFVRGIVSTAGTGVTAGYVLIKAWS